MKTSDFDYHLPEELIALYPPEERGNSRLLCLDRSGGQIEDRQFNDLKQLLSPGDLLVFNNTRVIPARLFAHKSTGGQVECLVERILSEHQALAHLKASKTPKPGTIIQCAGGAEFTVLERRKDLFLLECSEPILPILHHEGHMPLPPYIKREDVQSDQERYQTVYAKSEGAVAAPTAGLHFTENLLTELEQLEIEMAFITLHVGAGTFQPVRVDDVTAHQMHSEVYEVDESAANKLRAAKESGRRIIAVGTTSVRTLETIGQNETLAACQGETDIFIYPGFEFQLVDAMITNFHLPQSTLLMLVSAFASKAHIMNAYQHAISQQYRFFSYGDAMFIGDLP